MLEYFKGITHTIDLCVDNLKSKAHLSAFCLASAERKSEMLSPRIFIYFVLLLKFSAETCLQERALTENFLQAHEAFFRLLLSVNPQNMQILETRHLNTFRRVLPSTLKI